MKLARRSLFQGVCGALLGRVLPEPVAERAAARLCDPTSLVGDLGPNRVFMSPVAANVLNRIIRFEFDSLFSRDVS